jgi:hypothetical protein
MSAMLQFVLFVGRRRGQHQTGQGGRAGHRFSSVILCFISCEHIEFHFISLRCLTDAEQTPQSILWFHWAWEQSFIKPQSAVGQTTGQTAQDRELNSTEDEFGTTREVQNCLNCIDIEEKEGRLPLALCLFESIRETNTGICRRREWSTAQVRRSYDSFHSHMLGENAENFNGRNCFQSNSTASAPKRSRESRLEGEPQHQTVI